MYIHTCGNNEINWARYSMITASAAINYNALFYLLKLDLKTNFQRTLHVPGYTLVSMVDVAIDTSV